MKDKFISLVSSPPDGFEYRTPTERDLLGCRVAIVAASLDAAFSLMDEFCERVCGVVITEGDVFSHIRIGPRLWRVTAPEHWRSQLRAIAACFLDMTSDDRQGSDEIVASRAESSSTSGLDGRRQTADHENIERLGTKAQDLRTGVEARAQSDADLTESKKMLNDVLDTIPVRVFWKDLEGVYLGCNQLFAEDAGRSSPAEVVGDTDHNMGWADQADLYRSDDRKVMESGLPRINYEEPQTTPDGERIWLRTSKIPLRNTNGSVYGVLGTYEDITERKRSEETLRESEALAIAILEATVDGIITIDQGGVIESFNSTAERIFGYAADEVIGRNVKILMPSPDHEQHDSYLRNYRETGIAKIIGIGREIIARRKDGSTFPADLAVSKFTLGDQQKLAGSVRDITERKRAEEELRRSEEKFSKAFHSSAALMAISTVAEGRYADVNDAFVNATGYSREEVIGRTSAELNLLVHLEDRQAVRLAFEQSFRTAQRDLEVQIRTKDGEIRDGLFSVDAVTIDEEPCWLTVMTDITERKRAEKERSELEAQLRQSQKMEAVGQLAGGVAHDFNNILTAILGNVELCMERVRDELGASHRIVQCIEEIEEGAQRASGLTTQLLTFSRRDVMQPETLNLNNIVAGLDRMLRRLITEDITLETFPAPDLDAIHADAGQLEQVIVNLVVNAVHAMPDGGCLTLQTQNVTLDEEHAQNHADARPGPHVLLTVSDTGHGMDASTRERIFEPFFTTKPPNKGTGLGLATVHGIARRTGGHIVVESEPDHGAIFRIYLPALEAKAPDHTLLSPTKTSLRGHETILLCEDDRSVRELIARSLRSAGYTVISAGGGQEGVEAARAHTDLIDLLITDVIMPDMNGRELSERLSGALPGLPTLFISGYTSNVIAEHGALDQRVSFLEKPFTRGSLLAKVREAINKTPSRAKGGGA